MRRCEQNGEFDRVEMRCAVKSTMPLVGKTQNHRKRKLKQVQAASYDNQIPEINIDRVAGGAVLCAAPIFSELIGLILGSYKEHFSVSQRKSARFTTSGKTSAELVSLAQAPFPNFLGVALGPLRLVFDVEQAARWRDRTFR